MWKNPVIRGSRVRQRQPWAGPPSPSPSLRSTAGFVLQLNFRICPRCAAGEVPRGASQEVWVKTAEPAAGSRRRVAIPSLRNSEGNCQQPGPRRPLGETGEQDFLSLSYLPARQAPDRSRAHTECSFWKGALPDAVLWPVGDRTESRRVHTQGYEKGCGQEQLCGPLRASLPVPTGGHGWRRPLCSMAARLFCVVNSRPGGSDGF